jgi:cytochrome c551/c552
VKKLLALSFALVLADPGAQAADIEAGKKIATTACAACHGVNGVSVSEVTPNLAAQRAGYLEAQMKAYKDGARKLPGATSPTAIMSAMATQLSVSFPENYKETFTKYHTINFPATKQVRYFYANPTAVSAAKAGKSLPDGSVLFVEVFSAKLDADKKPVVGTDGFYVADKLLQYTAMASGEGWGKDIPDMLRNADWNYAIFSTEKKHQPGVNQAVCLACHKPLSDVSYTFTLKQIAEAK